jgi:hypothetical protein
LIGFRKNEVGALLRAASDGDGPWWGWIDKLESGAIAGK